MDESGHVPVMLQEVLEGLDLQAGETVIDGTLGLAGHSLEMIEQIKPGGTLIGFDWDEQMLERARTRIGSQEGIGVELFHADYRAIAERIKSADAVLLDLGLNNAQIEDQTRGISFKGDGPLDMRMDRSKGSTAADVLNKMSAHDLEFVLLEYGGERWARKIAQVICDRRKQKPLETTHDLVDCVLAAIPAAKRDKRIHPATRTFQAIRIYINDELEGLQEAIEGAARVLNPEGRIAVLSYHSGEDRAVKLAFRHLAKEEDFEIITKKPLTPSEQEIRENPKSRSAKLRLLMRAPRKEAS